MLKLSIHGKEYAYNDGEIIDFSEGLIGLPNMRRAALIPLDEFAPFCWLASVDDDKYRFLVVNPKEIYDDFSSPMPNEMGLTAAESLQSLAIVKISSEWQKTTVNLRAPIYINMQTKRGTQFILNDSRYKLAETLPNN